MLLLWRSKSFPEPVHRQNLSAEAGERPQECGSWAEGFEQHKCFGSVGYYLSIALMYMDLQTQAARFGRAALPPSQFLGAAMI